MTESTMDPSMWRERAQRAEAEVSRLRAEVERLREALRIVQLDNHHNAAVCPYCDPPTAVLAAPPAEGR